MEKTETRINLEPKVKPIIKAVLSLRGFLMLLIALGMLHTGIAFLKESVVVMVLCLAAFVLFIVLAAKFLEQVFYKEYLVLHPDHITLVLKTFLREKQQTFALKNISVLDFAGRQDYTHHTMHNPVFDITGLEAGEKELQYVIDAGTFEIVCEGKSHRFGKNMNSWDAEEVIQRIENYYQKSFHKNHTNAPE